MSRWFRHYAGMMRDEKLVSAAVKSKQPVERVVWVWGAILESASEINDNGRFEFDCGEAAYFLRCDVAELDGIVASLEGLGRLSAGVVTRWGDRQFSSDAAAERQRRYRERKSGASVREGDDNRNGDAQSDVTPPSRDGVVTAQETETDTEAEKEPSSLRSDGERAQKRAARLPENWTLPDGWGDDAVAAGLPPSLIDLEAAKMRDWSRSSPDGAKRDWRAAWRNWCRRAVERMPNARGSPPQPRHDPRREVLAQLIGTMENAESDQETEGNRPAPLRLSAH